MLKMLSKLGGGHGSVILLKLVSIICITIHPIFVYTTNTRLRATGIYEILDPQTGRVLAQPRYAIPTFFSATDQPKLNSKFNGNKRLTSAIKALREQIDVNPRYEELNQLPIQKDFRHQTNQYAAFKRPHRQVSTWVGIPEKEVYGSRTRGNSNSWQGASIQNNASPPRSLNNGNAVQTFPNFFSSYNINVANKQDSSTGPLTRQSSNLFTLGAEEPIYQDNFNQNESKPKRGVIHEDDINNEYIGKDGKPVYKSRKKYPYYGKKK